MCTSITITTMYPPPSQAANRGHVSQSEADDSETDDGPADAATEGSSRKLRGRSSIRGAQAGAGGGRRQSRVSPGPSPRLPPKGVGGSGNGGITTPVSGARRRGCSVKNPMGEVWRSIALGGRVFCDNQTNVHFQIWYRKLLR